MNILFITILFVGFMVSEIQRVSVFGHCPYSVTFPYRYRVMATSLLYNYSLYSLQSFVTQLNVYNCNHQFIIITNYKYYINY